MVKKNGILKHGWEISVLDGIIRTIRNPMTKKIMKEVCIGKKKYRRNPIYRTYNSIDDNKILYIKMQKK